jgi:Zn-finger nucleic acid-binding protein
MEKVEFQGIEIDRCTLCKGMWFDALEHEALKKMEGSEVIDQGDPEVGELFNAEDRISCPNCHTEMIRMVDRDQPHIWFESCSTCYGVFFDAGEFVDFKRHTLLDTIRDIRAKART